jgi:hypothetical protein
MRRSLYNSVRALPAVKVTAISANGNTDGASVALDQAGADYSTASVVAFTGAQVDGTYTIVVQESANGTSGWTEVPAARRQGSAVLNAADAVAEVGIVPDPARAPFLRVRVTASDIGEGGGGTVGAVLLLGSPARTPVAR